MVPSKGKDLISQGRYFTKILSSSNKCSLITVTLLLNDVEK